MSRKQCCQQREDVPAWFMTYSDVITLLMTFFILLLTFATREPELFSRMQTTLSAGGGASGIAGRAQTPVDRDAVLIRERPASSRITTRGSEMAPLHRDPSFQSVSKGLKSLQEESQDEQTGIYEIRWDARRLFGIEGELTSFARQVSRMMAAQLRSQPLTIRLSGDVAHTEGLLNMAGAMHSVSGVRVDQVAVSQSASAGKTVTARLIRLQ